MILIQILTLLILLVLVFCDLKRWREILLTFFSISLVFSLDNLSSFYRSYILILTFIISFILLFFRKTFPSIVYDTNLKGKDLRKLSFVLIGFILLILVNIIQYRTGLFLNLEIMPNRMNLNLTSEQLLRFSAISLMFITLAIVKTGEADE